MAIQEQQQSIRKSLLATTAIAVVLTFSNKSDINWAISLDGVYAWVFLLVAHGYFSIMWLLWRLTYVHQFTSTLAEQEAISPGPEKVLRHINRVGAQSWIMRRFTDICAWLGLGVIVFNLVRIFVTPRAEFAAVY